MKRINHKKTNGYTLIQTLLALLVCSICALILSLQASALRKMSCVSPPLQEEFAILQIREMAMLANAIDVENGVLILDQGRREERLAQDGKRLVKRPGYEILMEGVDQARFQKRSGKGIELVVEIDGRKETVLIAESQD